MTKLDTTKLENRNSKLVTASTPATRVRDFTDLDAWRLARELRKLVFHLTSAFPADERFVLVQQARRASISITANTAERFGRYLYQENIQFCRQARGSAYETRDHFIAARDLSYISEQQGQEVDMLAQRVIQMVNGYIRSTKTRQALPSAE